MKTLSLILAIALCAFLVGCKTGNTEQDAQNMRKEFSDENYEKNMKAAGRGEELEKEKQRQAQANQGGQ